jgi:membrane protein
VLPDQAMEGVEQVIGEIQKQGHGGFLSFGIMVAIWVASARVRATMLALNIAYEVAERRPAWQRYPRSIVYTIGLAMMLILAAGLMVIGPQVMRGLGNRRGWIGSSSLCGLGCACHSPACCSACC